MIKIAKELDVEKNIIFFSIKKIIYLLIPIIIAFVIIENINVNAFVLYILSIIIGIIISLKIDKKRYFIEVLYHYIIYIISSKKLVDDNEIYYRDNVLEKDNYTIIANNIKLNMSEYKQIKNIDDWISKAKILKFNNQGEFLKINEINIFLVKPEKKKLYYRANVDGLDFEFIVKKGK